MTFGTVKIIESLDMVDHVEDWSRVRSPGRARRRRWKHPQNIRIIAVPKKHAISIDGGRTLIMHPETARQLREMVAAAPPPPRSGPFGHMGGLSVVQPFPLFNSAGVS